MITKVFNKQPSLVPLVATKNKLSPKLAEKRNKKGKAEIN